MQLKIGVIINKTEIGDEYAACIQDDACLFYFRISALTAAIDVARELIKEHEVDAIITMKATSRVLSECFDIPIVPLNLKSFDILKTLWTAGHMGVRPAFVEIDTQDIHYDFDEIVKLLGFGVQRYAFRGFEQIPELVDNVISDGCDIVASMGTKTTEEFQKRGVTTLLFAPGIESFLTAVEEVKQICKVRRQEIERSKWLNAIANETNEGILIWDEQGTLVLINNAAQRALRQPQHELLGQNIHELRKRIPLLETVCDANKGNIVFEYDGNEYLIVRQDIFNGDKLLGSIARLSEVHNIRELELQTRRSRSENGFIASIHFHNIRGTSPAMAMAKEMAQKYAKSNANVLITGESGSGKEMFAQSIHNVSSYWEGPFVAVNCSALTETLLESELFGYEEGAFTGAKKRGNPGLMELAHGGTLFMDEIGEMPQPLQVKLLRVLQERSIRRIGGNRNIPLDVRFIFATNRNLTEAVQAGRFRADLFYRMNVLPLRLPALRERKQDIPTLARSIAAEVARRTKSGYNFSNKCIQVLTEYDWPGNVRELYNFIERLIVLDIDDPVLVRAMLAENQEEYYGSSIVVASETTEEDEHLSIPIGSMKDMENTIIAQLYERFGGDRKRLEQTLQLSRSTLWRYLKVMDE